MTAKKAAQSPKGPPALPKRSAVFSARHLGALVERVVAIVEEAQARVVRSANSAMVLSYWHIGREIVEFIQQGSPRAEYGEQVLEGLSANLRQRVGRGYSVRNLRNFRTFYQAYVDREPTIRDVEPREFGRRHLPNVDEFDAAQLAAAYYAVAVIMIENGNCGYATRDFNVVAYGELWSATPELIKGAKKWIKTLAADDGKICANWD